MQNYVSRVIKSILQAPFSSKGKLGRIVGLKQKGVNFFKTFFANFEGMEKANEESKPKEWKCSSYKTVLADFEKINQLLAVYKNNLQQI